MTARGKYVRTNAIREKNRRHARGECPLGCECDKHRSQEGRCQPKCRPSCTCGKHYRTPEHNARIAISVALTKEAQRA